MVLLSPCIACQHADHEHCQVGHAAPEGMLGGWKCSCSCRDVEAAEREPEPEVAPRRRRKKRA
jgi:hypothetical protein